MTIQEFIDKVIKETDGMDRVARSRNVLVWDRRNGTETEVWDLGVDETGDLLIDIE